MRSEERIAKLGSTHRSPHLSDDQLMEAYVLAGEDAHLAVCRPCKARFDDARARASAGSRRRDPRSRQRVHLRAASRAARSHHAAARAPRASRRSRHVPASRGEPGRGPARSGPCPALGCRRGGGRSRGGAVPRVRDGSPHALRARSTTPFSSPHRVRRRQRGRPLRSRTAGTISSSPKSRTP